MGEPATVANDPSYFTADSVRGLSPRQIELLRVGYPITHDALGTPTRWCPSVVLAKCDVSAALGLERRGLVRTHRERISTVLAERPRHRGPRTMALTVEGKAYVVAELRPMPDPKLSAGQLRALAELVQAEREGIAVTYLRERGRTKVVVGPRWASVRRLHHLGLCTHTQTGPLLEAAPTTYGIAVHKSRDKLTLSR